MPSSTYPGVYVEQLSGGVHTISGIATSIAVFVGWAPQGSVTRATLVESWSEYERLFGGFHPDSYLGYAVNHFFGNGGSQAYILRLVASTVHTPTLTAATTASATAAGLTLHATSPGTWANTLRSTLTAQPGSTTRYSLLVQQVTPTATTTLESFVDLSFSPSDPNYIVTVIDAGSAYITFVDPAAPPTATPPPIAGAVPATISFLGNALDGDVLKPTDQQFELALQASAANVPILDQLELFNLLCIPGETDAATIGILQQYCFKRRAFLIVDSPQFTTPAALTTSGPVGTAVTLPIPGITGTYASNSAYYFPWILAPNPLSSNRPALYPPCGFIAGIYASTDASRGVWKAPAGIQAGLTGDSGLQFTLTDQQNGDLNTQAINCLRQFKVYGDVVWGSRTLAGNDQVGSEWKYVPIRRLALFLESSLYYGTQWVVFEPNDETLWGQIRMNVGSFMQGLFMQGAFAGTTPQKAYFVKCDSSNNPASSIALGIVTVTIGFAPLFPAEFVVIQIQQIIAS